MAKAKSMGGGSNGWGLMAAAALAGGVGCSSQLDPAPAAEVDAPSGHLRLSLVPVSGVTLNSVSYVVAGSPTIPGAPLPSGVLPTPGTSDTFSFGIPVPVGGDYTLSLTAASAELGDDITCTGAFGPFDIAPHASVNLSLTLTCVDNSNGQLIGNVDVVADACPRLIVDYAVALPAQGEVGGSLALSALGHDLDGKPVSYGWSLPPAYAAVGFFGSPTAQSTSFNCAGGGDGVPLMVTVDNGECTTSLVTTVSCIHIECGDGVWQPAFEDCDVSTPPGTPGSGEFGCPADCTFACGDGVVEAPAEECEIVGGMPTGACTAQCRNRVASCGDGFLTAPEVCDGPLGTPFTQSCNPTCDGFVDSDTCGDGVISARTGEECELPSSMTCSDDCQTVATQECVDCEQNGSCFEFSNSCIDNTTDPAARAACFAVQECITDTNCGDGASSLTSCFCGSLSTADCIAAPSSGAGSPAGPCAGLIRSAMGGAGVSNAQVLTRYTNIAFPGGAAIARYNCTKLAPACTAVCGF